MALNIKSLFSLGHPRPRKVDRYILAAPLAPPTDTQTYDCVKQPLTPPKDQKSSPEDQEQKEHEQDARPTSKEIAAKTRKKLNVI